MSGVWWIWLVLAIAPLQGGERSAEDAERLARWREALELGLPAEVVAEGPALVSGRGRLADDAEALALVARALGEVGRTPTAFALLDGARPASAAQRAHVDLARASLLLDQDELDAVIALLAPGGPDTLRHAEQPESWLLVGRAWARGGEGAKADVFLERFLELAPLHPAAPGAWYMLAQHAVARRDAAAASELRTRAEAATRWHSYFRARRLQKRASPNEPLPRLGLAQLWTEVGRLEEAHAELRELVERHPEFERGWSHLGEVERQRGADRAAREAYGRALELDPANTYARLGRARLALAEDRLDEARADLTHLTEDEHDDASRRRDAWLVLARVEAAAQDPPARDAAYARYRELGGEEPLEGG